MSGEGITTTIEDDIRIQIFVQSDVTSWIGHYALVTMTLSYWWDHTHIIHIHQNSAVMSYSERIRDLLIQMSKEFIASVTYGLPQSCYRCLSVHLAGMKQTLVLYLQTVLYNSNTYVDINSHPDSGQKCFGCETETHLIMSWRLWWQCSRDRLDDILTRCYSFVKEDPLVVLGMLYF